jgi:alkanesulfonate monooxygenase SsuD/methylene tetrahydromethanopterin reductase-like flavin-dependent oxidoreductase (luciferase family)
VHAGLTYFPTDDSMRPDDFARAAEERGGAGSRAIRRAVRYGQGWIPLMSGDENEPIGLLPRLREELEAAGRDPADFEVSIYFCPPSPDVVGRCRDAGITRVLFPTPSAPADAVLSTLDTYAKLIG